MKLNSLGLVCYQALGGEEQAPMEYAVLKALSELSQQDARLEQLLIDPSIHSQTKKQILQNIFAACLAETESAFLQKLLDFLQTKKSLHLLPGLHRSLQSFERQAQGIEQAIVYAAESLDIQELDQLKELLGNSKSIQLEHQADPELVAGFVLQTDRYIVDNSLKARLAAMSRL